VSETLVRGDERDPILEEQLAHLDAIERRQELRYASGEAELTGVAHSDIAEVALPELAWPEIIPEPPPPEDGLDAYQAWLETARTVLAARAARNRDELQRLTSQWVLAQRHLARLRPEEVGSLVETQARLRERIAADETVCHLLRTLGSHLGTWASAHPAQEMPLPTADLDLVRRLLDESAEERARAGRELMGTVLEALCSITLDMEVVQRQAEQQPQIAAEAVHNLQTRIADMVEDLRDLPHTELVMPEADEPLHATLRRCVDHHQSRLSVDLAWSGGGCRGGVGHPGVPGGGVALRRPLGGHRAALLGRRHRGHARRGHRSGRIGERGRAGLAAALPGAGGRCRGTAGGGDLAAALRRGGALPAGLTGAARPTPPLRPPAGPVCPPSPRLRGAGGRGGPARRGRRRSARRGWHGAAGHRCRASAR
jgi:hypothetical protein